MKNIIINSITAKKGLKGVLEVTPDRLAIFGTSSGGKKLSANNDYGFMIPHRGDLVIVRSFHKDAVRLYGVVKEIGVKSFDYVITNRIGTDRIGEFVVSNSNMLKLLDYDPNMRFNRIKFDIDKSINGYYELRSTVNTNGILIELFDTQLGKNFGAMDNAITDYFEKYGLKFVPNVLVYGIPNNEKA